ncbi:MAG: hypothetical protein LBS69_12230 [Prevotellaceae bacterium]|jgi:hypothetical protein|nr:hypothetical protein [Prevotellaceae bacterium]
MKTHELFQKHFGDVVGVGLKHPNIEAFFGELNEICKEEARQRLEKDIQDIKDIKDVKELKKYLKTIF